MTLASSSVSVRDELTTTAPAAYLPGYEKARIYDQAAADNYLKHTTIGDPELDPIMEELSAELSPEDLHRFVAAGIEQHDDVLRIAPPVFARFLQESPGASVALLRAFRSRGQSLPRERRPDAGRIRDGSAGGGLFDSHRQVLPNHRKSGEHSETSPAEQPPHDGDILPRRSPKKPRGMETVDSHPVRTRADTGAAGEF